MGKCVLRSDPMEGHSACVLDPRRSRDEPSNPGDAPSRGKIPDARKVVVPDAGHAVNLLQPERFERVLLTFLEEIGA